MIKRVKKRPQVEKKNGKKHPPLSFWKNLLHCPTFNYSDSYGMTTGGYKVSWYKKQQLYTTKKLVALMETGLFSTRKLLFPNPKGRKLSLQIQNLNYCWKFQSWRALSIDFGDFCVNKIWTYSNKDVATISNTFIMLFPFTNQKNFVYLEWWHAPGRSSFFSSFVLKEFKLFKLLFFMTDLQIMWNSIFVWQSTTFKVFKKPLMK